MNDVRKTKSQLLGELTELHQRVIELETNNATLNEERNMLRMLIDTIPYLIYAKDTESRFLVANKSLAQVMGTTPEELLGKTDYDFYPNELAEAYFTDEQTIIQTGQPLISKDEIVLTASGSEGCYLTSKTPFFDDQGNIKGIVGAGHDITTRKQAEQQIQTNIHFLEHLDQINRVIQQSNNVEALFENVLEAVFTIFDCDRIWLFYPCDPNAPSLQVPWEHTRPEYPGAKTLSQELPMSPGRVKDMQEALASENPLMYTAGTEHPIYDEEIATRFGVQAQMFMAIYPMIGSPWMFGMHQCSYARHWTQEEQRLFKEIGQRLGDALSTLLSLRNLRESEERYRIVSELISDYAFAWAVNPDGSRQHLWTTEDSFTRLTGYTWPKNPDPFLLTQPNDQKILEQDIVETLQGKTTEKEYLIITKSGEERWIRLRRQPIWDEQEQRVTRYYGVAQDITKHKLAQEALRQNSFALEHAADAIYWVNKAEIIDVNEAACRMLGYSREEFAGMSITNIDPRMTEAEILQIWDYIKKEGVTSFETQHKTKDGRIVPVEIMANYFEFEGKGLNCCFVRDITERKQAQTALQESEERLQQAVRVGDIGIFDHDHIQNTIYLSPQYREMIGQKSGTMTTLDKFSEQVHPEDRERVFQAIRRGHDPAGDGNNYIEHRIIDYNGTLHWINTRTHTFFAGEGSDRHPVRTIGATIDITERKQAEAALHQSEERLRQAIQVSNIGIIDHNRINKTMYLSPEYREMLGWGPDESVTFEKFFEQTHPDDMEKTLQAVQRANDPASDGTYYMERRIIDRSGAVRWLSTHAHTFFEGEGSDRHPVRTVGATVDITERKQAETALHQSEERLRQAVQVGDIGIFDHDHIQNTIYLSPRYREMLSYGLDEPITMENFAELTHPEDFETVLQAVKQSHDPSSDGNYHMEHRIIDRNGTVRWLNARSQTFFEGKGSDRHPVRTVGATVDITERKQMEQQHLDLALEKERSDTLRMLIGNISHDIKTPLAIINTSLYLLERLTEPEKRQGKIDNIKNQVRVLENFIQDLLAISRLDGNPKLHLTPVDVNELVLDIEAETQPMIEQKQITFTLDLGEDIAPIQADQADLRRALTNLVENALNYTPTGQAITIRTRKQADNTLVEVTDTGIGIKENELPHIFDRFYRSPQAQTIIRSGSGLGLAIVRRVVEMHGGSIDVTSQPGTGTTFRIQLPLYLERR